MKAGKLRALGSSGDEARCAARPDVPTVAEAGVPGYERHRVVRPGGAGGHAASEVVEKLNAEVNKILAMPDVRARFLAQGVEPQGGTPEQFGEHIKQQMAKWAKVVQDAGVKAE